MRITGRPSRADFYRADHRSGALALTAALVEAFVRETEHRGKRALIVMLPGASSFRARAEFGQPEYAPLIAELATRKIEVYDPIRALLSVLILEGVVHFNVLSPEFNHNIVQLPLWAFIAYASHRAIRENRVADWLLLGFAAALGMYGKYSTALLLIAIAAYALSDRTARQQLAEKGPWLAIASTQLWMVKKSCWRSPSLTSLPGPAPIVASPARKNGWGNPSVLRCLTRSAKASSSGSDRKVAR